MFDAILTPRVLAILGAIAVVLFVHSVTWATFKIAFQKVFARPVPRDWFTNANDVLAEFANNLLGAINRGLKLAGKPGLFLPTQPGDGSAPTPSAATIESLSAENATLREALATYQRHVSDEQASAAPAPRSAGNSQLGAVEPRALVVIALVLVAAAVGCPASQQFTRPALGDVDGCEPRSTRCSPDGRPQVCSGSRRWTDADGVCTAGVNVAARCCLTTSPITGNVLHACVLAERCIATDGGAR